MYQGKHRARPSGKSGYGGGKRPAALLIALVLIAAMAIGGTLAYLSTKTDPTANTFTPSTVSCSVTESFDGSIKSNVNVTNTGDTEAYIRVKLISYRVSGEDNKHIGGATEIPAFTPGENWVKYGEYYYYTLPVAPSVSPATHLIDSITLHGQYNDADGGRQAIDVMAEAIQSTPASAVGSAWGVSIAQGSVTAYSGN